MAATTTSKWADLLKPPAPKPAPVEEKTVSTAAPAAVAGETIPSAFDAEKFTQYARAMAADHVASLARPTDEQFSTLQATLASSKTQGLEALRELSSAEQCALFFETRVAFYLPTQEELDVAAGWEIRSETKKAGQWSGAYLVLSADAKRVMEVVPREKGEKKVRGAEAVNLLARDGESESATAAVVQRVKTAISDWNARAARSEGKKLPISFTPAATPLLSSALSTCFALPSAGLVGAEDTAILAADLSAVITVFKNHVKFAQWTPRTATAHGAKKFNKPYGKNDKKESDDKDKKFIKRERNAPRTKTA